jgi:C_GCAxxG_C_C family probable redox protein
VVAALQDAFDLRNDIIFKAATALAGGGARAIDGSCGAYTGAILFFGSIVGRERNDFKDEAKVRLKTHDLAKRLHDKFIEEYGSVVCQNIQTKTMGRSYYLIDPDEYKKFLDAGAHDIYCPDVVGKAAKWAAEILLEAKLVKEPKSK